MGWEFEEAGKFGSEKAADEYARRNNIAGVAGLTADWRFPAFKAGGISRAWAGDIMYERRFVRPVAEFLKHCMAPGGVVWLAEPCRTSYREFLAILREAGCTFFRESPTNQQFVVLDNAQVEALAERVRFSTWEKLGDGRTVIRLVTSWSTTPDDIAALKAALHDVL